MYGHSDVLARLGVCSSPACSSTPSVELGGRVYCGRCAIARLNAPRPRLAVASIPGTRPTPSEVPCPTQASRPASAR